MEESQQTAEIEESIEERRRLIEKECNASKIDLTSFGLDDLDALTVAICLFQKDSKIDTLYLGSNSICDEGIEAICNSLSKHSEIQHLFLGNNLFRDIGVTSLSNVLPELKSLSTLSLGGAQISDSACTSFATSLMAMDESNLKYLFLNGNCIGDEGLLSLAYYWYRVALSSEKFELETLHLGDNEFTEVGVKLLAEWLESNSSLIKLFLNDNEMGEEGVAHISEALCSNTKLKFLSLASCGIIDETFKPMLACLSVNETLESLHIWSNLLTDKTSELIIEVLRKHNHTINDLQAFNNPIQEYELFQLVWNMQELQELISKNSLEVEEDPQEDNELMTIIQKARKKLAK